LITGPRGNPTERSAFTLLELILVMVLISVLLGVAAPSLRGFHGARRTADAAARMLSLTHYARSQAIAQGTVYRLNVDTGEKAYWLTAQIGGAYVELDNEFGRRFALPETVDVAISTPWAGDQSPYVQFYPSGRCDEAAVRLVGLQGEAYEVASPSATESFRIISLSEADNL